MTLYSLFTRNGADGPDAAPQAVAERFSWFAFLLPPLHALVHRHWGQLGLFVLGLAGLVLGARFLGAEAVCWLYLPFALAFGFAAPGAERRALRRRGYAPAGHVFAADADLARLAFLENRP